MRCHRVRRATQPTRRPSHELCTDCLAQLDRLGAAHTLPRVRALHLPPDPPPGQPRGEFCALELQDGSLGLSYVLLDDTLARLRMAMAAWPARKP
jgi:hypothetical protein